MSKELSIQERAYLQGFIDKCAEYGVDPVTLLEKRALIGKGMLSTMAKGMARGGGYGGQYLGKAVTAPEGLVELGKKILSRMYHSTTLASRKGSPLVAQVAKSQAKEIAQPLRRELLMRRVGNLGRRAGGAGYLESAIQSDKPLVNLARRTVGGPSERIGGFTSPQEFLADRLGWRNPAGAGSSGEVFGQGAARRILGT